MLSHSLPSLGHRFEQHESCCDPCHLAVVPKSLFTQDIFSRECNYTAETTWAWKLCTCSRVKPGKEFCCKPHLIPVWCVTNNHPCYWQTARTGHAPAAYYQHYISALCLRSWSLWPAGDDQVYSSAPCRAHTCSARKKAMWGYSACILISSVKGWCSFFFFLCRTSALARARFCKVQSPGVRQWLSLVPCHQRPRRTVIVLQECLTSFGNAEHLPGLELLGWTGQKQAHALHLAQAMLLKDMRKFFILDYEPALALTEASGFCFCTLM